MAAQENVYRLKDIINNHQYKDVRNDAVYLKEFIENDDGSRANIILVDNLIDKYHNEIIKDKITVKMNADEQHKYFYNPKLLCYNLYGNTELWKLLLDINQMYSVTQFCQEYIYIMQPGFIDRIFTEIINVEEHSLNLNNDEVETARYEYEQYSNIDI